MIRAEFQKQRESLTGFRISGHSGYAESGRDIVCAAVSSATQYVINLLDMYIGNVDIQVNENEIICKAKEDNIRAVQILDVFRIHLEMICEDYPNTIKIIISEV